MADWQAGYTLTAAPLIVKNKVLIGPGGGEFGVRGFLVAYDADTGKEVWKTYTVPAPGEAGSETWPGNTEAWRTGGGAPWLTGAYDPDLNLIYWGTSNPSPVFYGGTRQGDNLYTSSMLAFDADTGKIKWHFQFTPHDVWDYDGVNQPMLLDNVKLADGRVVAKALAQANRNGHFYLLDRTNGQVIYAHPFIHVDSIKVDPKTGKMTPLKWAKPNEPVVACGHGTAGKEWVSMAYSPLTQFVYVPAIEMCGKFFVLDLAYQKGRPYYGGGHERLPPASGHVSAIDLATGKAAWRYDTEWPMYAGVLATGGGLLFVGNPQGELEALDQKTGKKLWGFKTGSGIVTNPMSFQVDGRQYVAIVSGWSIVPSKAIAGAKLLNAPGQKNVLGSGMLFVFALPDATQDARTAPGRSSATGSTTMSAWRAILAAALVRRRRSGRGGRAHDGARTAARVTHLRRSGQPAALFGPDGRAAWIRRGDRASACRRSRSSPTLHLGRHDVREQDAAPLPFRRTMRRLHGSAGGFDRRDAGRLGVDRTVLQHRLPSPRPRRSVPTLPSCRASFEPPASASSVSRGPTCGSSGSTPISLSTPTNAKYSTPLPAMTLISAPSGCRTWIAFCETVRQRYMWSAAGRPTGYFAGTWRSACDARTPISRSR